VQLLTPAGILAGVNGNPDKTVTVGDIEEVRDLFQDHRTSAKRLEKEKDSFLM